MAWTLRERIVELDINPVFVRPAGAGVAHRGVPLLPGGDGLAGKGAGIRGEDAQGVVVNGHRHQAPVQVAHGQWSRSQASE